MLIFTVVVVFICIGLEGREGVMEELRGVGGSFGGE